MKLKQYGLGLVCVTLCTLAVAQNAKPDSPQDASIIHNLIQSALERHPTVRARGYDYSGALNEMNVAKWQYFPTPVTSFQQFDKAQNAYTDTKVTTVGLKQPIWTFGRLSAGVANARIKQNIALATQNEAKRDVALDVILAWSETRNMFARVKVTTYSLAKHQESLNQISSRANEGVAAQSDVLLAQSRMEGVQAELIAAQSSLASAKKKLENLVGFNLSQEIIEKFEKIPPRTIITPNDIQLEEIYSIDPTLARLNAEYELIETEMNIAKSALSPEVSVQVVNRQGDVSKGVTQWVLGVDSRWGAGLSNLSTLSVFESKREAKSADIDARKLKLREQLNVDLLSSESIRNRIGSFNKVLSTTKSISDSWNRQYLSGKKTWQDVMNAYREMFQSEVQLAEVTSNLDLINMRLVILTKGVDAVLKGTP